MLVDRSAMRIARNCRRYVRFHRTVQHRRDYRVERAARRAGLELPEARLLLPWRP